MKLIFSITTTTIAAILLGSLIIISLGSCIQLDIHLKLRPSSCLYQIALKANDELLQQSPTTECISFHNDTATGITGSLPHVTLYLSDFQNDSLSNITYVLKYLISKRHICQPAASAGPPPPSVDIDHVMIQGSYSMYHISKTYFLQHLSDTIVMNSHSFIIPNQTIPEWVYNLPEPERSIKIDYVRQYGSPNVLDEFDPHMTVGYDEYTPSVNRQKILEECLSRFISNNSYNSKEKECVTGRGNEKLADKGIHWEIAVGMVGDWGTVLKDLWVMKLKECKDDHHELATFRTE